MPRLQFPLTVSISIKDGFGEERAIGFEVKGNESLEQIDKYLEAIKKSGKYELEQVMQHG